ncbi:helix-turn-helix domain-containing protein [Vagococcus fluvialis]|uniref:helix-turn-helix domain-containing protein n=1 Tax=Vagococcus fluvialis TaxID=2738 RepID=UPI001A8C0B7D|nr:helix-turn-helix transcriptional regulator [Vagococcus fluvialis]MBO0479316.1 helix-turn-helix transcriptional regulator [Vagococcus fluvialis]MBO0485174.1 helix-turn-helix transcriptional regulator [Vagococcus fluvialis]
MSRKNLKQAGFRIRKIRENLDLTMEDFALTIDPKAKKGTVSNWENGKNLPNKKRLQRIAELGGVSVDYILDGDAESEESHTQYFNNALKIINHNFTDLKTEEISLKLLREAIDVLLNNKKIKDVDGEITTFYENQINSLYSKKYTSKSDFRINSRTFNKVDIIDHVHNFPSMSGANYFYFAIRNHDKHDNLANVGIVKATVFTPKIFLKSEVEVTFNCSITVNIIDTQEFLLFKSSEQYKRLIDSVKNENLILKQKEFNDDIFGMSSISRPYFSYLASYEIIHHLTKSTNLFLNANGYFNYNISMDWMQDFSLEFKIDSEHRIELDSFDKNQLSVFKQDY